MPEFQKDMNMLEPNGFEDFDDKPFDQKEERSLNFFYEELHFWGAGGSNNFVPGTFNGVGYVR